MVQEIQCYFSLSIVTIPYQNSLNHTEVSCVWCYKYRP